MKRDVFDKDYAIAWTMHKIRSSFYDQRKREDEAIEYYLSNLSYHAHEPSLGLQIEALNFLRDQNAISGYKNTLAKALTILTISIIKPKFNELEEKYKYYPPTIEDHMEEIRKELNITPSKIEDQKVEESTSTKPYCMVENGFGYLKFGKYGPKIKIGKADGQPFRLMQCLTEPFGVAKTIDTVYEAIREAKDSKRRDPYTNTFGKSQKLEVIRNTIKEVQKGKKLQGKLKFKFDDVKSKIWLEYIG